jgi:RNA chaperone Hfq
VLEGAGWEAALESVAIVPFAGVQVALVGISLLNPPGALPQPPQVHVGGEVVGLSETEAVVRATLRALGQLIEEEPPPPARDRWSRMEAMRTHYHRLIRLPQAPPAASPEESAAEESAGGKPAGAGSMVQDPATEEPAAKHLANPTRMMDTIGSVRDIRPEAEGGAAMSTREEPYRAESSGRPAGRGSMEDDFYRQLMHSRAPVYIRCRDGYEIPEAVVKDFGTYSVMIEARGVEELVFKHAIISIRPRAALPRDTAIQA